MLYVNISCVSFMRHCVHIHTMIFTNFTEASRYWT